MSNATTERHLCDYIRSWMYAKMNVCMILNPRYHITHGISGALPFRLEAQVKNDRGNLPLHTAASFRAPLEVAEALLEAYPEAASITNNYGNLALHFTAWKKGPLDVEKLLLRIFPEGEYHEWSITNGPSSFLMDYLFLISFSRLSALASFCLLCTTLQFTRCGT
jgi:hypothetical protein